MAELILDHVNKVYDNGFHAVKDLSLDVRDGEFLVLVGPSGCGKTTALRMVAGLESITGGEVRIGDRVVNNLSSRDRNIAMVFQSYALYPHMSVRQNIGFGLALRKQQRSVINEKVDDAAGLLDLTALLDRKPKQLSGGQRQRVAMGRAIVRDADLFLMDEPLSNLDAKLRVQMRAEIASLQQTLNTTTVYVTHDQVEAMTMGHRVAVMRLGELLQIAPPQELYDYPDNLFVAGFIGTPPMTLFHANLVIDGESARIKVGDQFLAIPWDRINSVESVRSKAGSEIVVGARAEDMHQDPAPGREPLHVSVTLTEALGSSVQVGFTFPGTPVDESRLGSGLASEDDEDITRLGADGIVGVATFPPRTDVRVGEPLTVHVDTERLHFFDVETGRALR